MERRSIFDSFSIIPTRVKFYRVCLKEDEGDMRELANMIFKRVFDVERDRVKISKNNTRFVGLIVNYDTSEKNLEDIKNRFQDGKHGSLLESNFENVHAVLSGDFYKDTDTHQFSPRGEGEFPEETMCIFFYCCPNN